MRTARGLLGAAGLAVAAVALAAGAAGWNAGPTATATATSTTTSTTTTTATTAPGRRAQDLVALIDPLREADAPDPYVAVDRDRAWLFTTNTGHGNVPAWTWADGHLVVTDALPTLPSWARPGETWAPAATRSAAGGWVLAFTAATHDGHQCIGVATSSHLGGPYRPEDEPLVCDVERGGSIDPSFVDDGRGTQWLLYKDDGNCCGLPTVIRSVPLTDDGLELAGEPHELVRADREWEGGLVEGPTMSLVDGRWLLLYSANRWDDDDYAVGAAWCDSPAGPCTKQEGPVLSAGPGMDGPGGTEFVGRSSVVVFHAWPEDQVGYPTGATRGLRIGRVETDPTGAAVIRTAGQGGRRSP
jgi:hypothetical protein